MHIFIYRTAAELGEAAARKAAQIILSAIEQTGKANIVLATGTSQFETLKHLVRWKRIDWRKVVLFHLDEYIGISSSHPASFRYYLTHRFVEAVGELRAVYFIEGDAESPEEECRRIGSVIRDFPIDIALVGIGENGHLAFNDPPADFETREPYIVVELDERCRRQQLGEGWFEKVDDVPTHAISMSIQQIMKSKTIIASIPERRKAAAVAKSLEGEVSVHCPASILQKHSKCNIYLDHEAASLLSRRYNE